MDHDILVRKLKSIGVSIQVEKKWSVSYLNNRHQVTSIENCLSPYHEVRVRVPQESILGPLLFLIYVNNFPYCLEYCKVVMYADDTVLYYGGKSCHEIESHLNADLGKLAHWFDNNYLTLNTSKSKFVLFGSNRKLQSCHDVKLVMHNVCLENSDSIKYFGVKIHKNMT